MGLRKLKSYVKKNGKAKTAVALGLQETNAINNWLKRKEIPEPRKEAVKNLGKTQVVVVSKNEGAK